MSKLKVEGAQRKPRANRYHVGTRVLWKLPAQCEYLRTFIEAHSVRVEEGLPGKELPLLQALIDAVTRSTSLVGTITGYGAEEFHFDTGGRGPRRHVRVELELPCGSKYTAFFDEDHLIQLRAKVRA